MNESTAQQGGGRVSEMDYTKIDMSAFDVTFSNLTQEQYDLILDMVTKLTNQRKALEALWAFMEIMKYGFQMTGGSPTLDDFIAKINEVKDD